MLTIYVIRHGVTENNKNRIITGHLDSPLLNKAAHELNMVAEKLKNLKFSDIYSSDLGRARISAKIISKRLKLTISTKVTPELREIDYGDLTGTSKSDMRKNNLKFINGHSYQDGESLKQFNSRITNFIKSLQNKNKNLGNKNNLILIVTHSGCIRAIYSYFRGEDLCTNISMKIKNTIILKCTIHKNNVRRAKILQN